MLNTSSYLISNKMCNAIYDIIRSKQCLILPDKSFHIMLNVIGHVYIRHNCAFQENSKKEKLFVNNFCVPEL